jgi:hypothetical protein
MDGIERMDFGTFVWMLTRRGIHRDLAYTVDSRVGSVMSCHAVSHWGGMMEGGDKRDIRTSPCHPFSLSAASMKSTPMY